MNCKNCGRSNPSGSLYCQDCGHRLGDWAPPERAGRAPTPPTGIARGAQAAPASLMCPRCGTANASHMRFCNNCGFALASAPQVVSAPLSAPQVAPASSGYAAGSVYAQAPMPGSTVCWRCRAAGESAAEFCKFCGARYADDPSHAPAQLGPVGGSGSVGAALAHCAANGGGLPAPALEQAAGIGQPPREQHAPAARGSSYDEPRAGAAGSARALLVAILKDGSDGRVYAIHDEQTDLGRVEGHLLLADDPYLSARHARILARADGTLTLRDLDSLNGVYVRLREPVDLHDGDMVLLGQQVMRFEVLAETELPLGPATQRGVLVFGTPEVPRTARIVQYTTEGVGRDVHYLYRDETVIGREQGDIVCTDDPFMSRRHAAITVDRSQRRYVLRDLGSSNGTAVRIRGERALRPGDQFRVGRHLFRYDRPGEGGQGRSGA